MIRGWRSRQPTTPIKPLTEIRAVIQPGDVVLTGSRTRLSPAIQAFTRSPVSHAVLMVLHDAGIEADDHKWNLTERGGGTYLVRLSQIVTSKHNFVAVRRPADIDPNLLLRWANYRLSAHHPFASTGLVMMGFVRLRLLIWHARPFAPANRPAPASVEWVADGPNRLVCSELVYRGLITAGATIDLANAVFADAISSLRPTQPDPLPASMIRLAQEPRRELLLSNAMSQRPRRAQGSGLPRGARGKARWLSASGRQFVNQWKVRSRENIPGDHADFVCPADLLRTPSFTDVCAFQLRRGQWHRVEPSDYR